MRFGEVLLSSQTIEWSEFYLQYNSLKTIINVIVSEKSQTIFLNESTHTANHQSAESSLPNHQEYFSFINFKSTLLSNIEKIVSFYDSKVLTCARLENFIKLNSIGIEKLLKKHDKKTLGNPFLYPNSNEYLERLPNTKPLQIILESLKTLHQTSGGSTHHLDLEIVKTGSQRVLPFQISQNTQNFIIDMDGVIYHGQHLLPGVKSFISWLKKTNKKFLFLTNSSDKTPEMLRLKLEGMGISVSKDHFYTSALSTARFLAKQWKGDRQGRVYAIGEAGLLEALTSAGFLITEKNPIDYVVVGETSDDTIYNVSAIKKAINFLNPSNTTISGKQSQAEIKNNEKLHKNNHQKARLIATNVDLVDRALPHGWSPSVGSLVSSIESGSGQKAYYLGKPNPLMMSSAVELLGGKRSEDIQGGLEAGIETLLVLTGVTRLEDLDSFPYRPDYILSGLEELMQVIFANVYNFGIGTSSLSKSSLTDL